MHFPVAAFLWRRKTNIEEALLRVVDLNIGNAEMMLLTRTNSSKVFKKILFWSLDLYVIYLDTFESISNEIELIFWFKYMI